MGTGKGGNIVKIRIAYSPEEGNLATCIVETIKRLLPSVRVHENDDKPPWRYIFLTTKKPQKPSIHKESP